jgi:hypothetical protein
LGHVAFSSNPVNPFSLPRAFFVVAYWPDYTPRWNVSERSLFNRKGWKTSCASRITGAEFRLYGSLISGTKTEEAPQ